MKHILAIVGIGVLVGGCSRSSDDDAAAALAPFLARFVAFHSDVTNLVAGDTNAGLDAFVRDRSSGTVSRVSVATGGVQGTGGGAGDPSFSFDGRFVSFSGDHTNLVAGAPTA